MCFHDKHFDSSMANILEVCNEVSNLIRQLIKVSIFIGIIMARLIILVMAIMAKLLCLIGLVLDPYSICLFKYL